MNQQLKSTARTHWDGDLLSGSGTTSLASGAAEPLRVTWKARTEEHGGLTSPEELIAAAHASCYSMSLSSNLSKRGTPPESIDTEATATFEKLDAGWTLTGMHLTVRASVPNVDEDTLREVAEVARTGCPVSRALAGNVEITVDAALA